jgi:adenine-specific DNA methylase
MRLALPPISCKVPTPPDLARAIVNALGDEPKARWLEPSHGAGIFIETISALGIDKDRIVGVDLDPKSSPADNLATTHRRTDFLKWAQTTDQRFDRIVGNPPYVSIKRLPPSLRTTAAQVLDVDGKAIGLSANVWYAFVLSSIELLNSGGTLAFVLPSAAEFADYSSLIREKIGKIFGSVELYRSKTSLFENVQEGTLVAIARGYNEEPLGVRRKEYDNKKSLIRALSNGDLLGPRCRANPVHLSTSRVKLDSVATIRLGGVTGDAAYFLMNESKRQHYDLPVSAFTPVLSKAKHLRGPALSKRDWEGLKKAGERIWLFNPGKKHINDPSVYSYLQLLPENGGCRRDAYKVSIREPWYKTPLPLAPDAFLSGMNQKGPWLCINEMGDRLSATNTLYAVRFHSREKEDWYMWALTLLTSYAQRQIRHIGRHYADGLVKFEPGPLGQIELPKVRIEADHKSLYFLAIKALFNSDLRGAKNIANSIRI